jgi:hypothetical protein
LAESTAVEFTELVPTMPVRSKRSKFMSPLEVPSVLPLDMMGAAVRCLMESPSASRKITFFAAAFGAAGTPSI